MADKSESKAEASAEEAYSKALQESAAVEKAEAEKPVKAAKGPVEVKPQPKPAPAKPAVVRKRKTAAKSKASSTGKAKAPARAAKTASKAKKPAAPSIKKMSVTSSPKKITKPKETTMAKTEKFAEGFKDFFAQAQGKAQEAFEKSSVMLGDYSDFAKGNVEAMVESGKILAEGLQDMSTNLVAEGRSMFETVSGDMKTLAAAKSPTDFLKIQSDMARKSFDSAVAYGSKNSEAMLKLASDVMAPISGRMSVAVEKARSIAA